MRSHFSSIACPKLLLRLTSAVLPRAHWLAGAGQRRRSPPWLLFPVSPARTPEYLEPSSVRHRERAPTGPAPLPLTSTRGASSEQGPCPPRASGLLVGRRSLTISHAASSSSLIPAYQGSMDRGGERGHGGAPATRRPENRRGGHAPNAKGGRYFIYRPPLGPCQPSDREPTVMI